MKKENPMTGLIFDFRNLNQEQRECLKKFWQKKYNELVSKGIKPEESDFYGT